MVSGVLMVRALLMVSGVLMVLGVLMVRGRTTGAARAGSANTKAKKARENIDILSLLRSGILRLRKLFRYN